VINLELKSLFSPEYIGNVKIKNRIVRTATYMAGATEKGYVTDNLVNIYDTLASGGIGLIISGYIAVHPTGSATPRMACYFDKSYSAGQKKLVAAVHEHSEVKFAAQIAHTGSQVYNPNYEPIGPSPLTNPYTNRTARELNLKEIEEIVQSFINAGIGLYECDYDMIQLHAGHGYILSDFLSPFTNKRSDEYGGSINNRIRIIREIFNGIKDAVGKSFPILIKLNVMDFLGVDKGLQFSEGKLITKEIVDIGFESVEPTSGRTNPKYTNNKTYPSAKINSPDEENFFLPYVKELKPLMNNCKMILMGGIRNPLKAEEFLREKFTDFVSLCRPLIYEPDLPNRWKSGDHLPALCNSCNACLETGERGYFYCPVKEKKERKTKD
jgi:2,4-dienoyl-CoA reductase-like NADH-dependent reductase (Old Yellow Enzyme family)